MVSGRGRHLRQVRHAAMPFGAAADTLRQCKCPLAALWAHCNAVGPLRTHWDTPHAAESISFGDCQGVLTAARLTMHSPLEMINWANAVLSTGAYTPGLMLSWTVNVGNDNTRWHW